MSEGPFFAKKRKDLNQMKTLETLYKNYRESIILEVANITVTKSSEQSTREVANSSEPVAKGIRPGHGNSKGKE